MSHLHERKEKVCLNCGAEIYDRYCHTCGQQNVEPKESVWHLIVHFVEDITHFDGKFFSTIKLLVTKPGFLSTEYMKGRRASYLNPIRMYLFISFVLFFLKFTFQKPEVENSQLQTSNTTQQDTAITSKKDTIAATKPKNRGTIFDYDSLKAYDSVQHTLPIEKKDKGLRKYMRRRIVSVREYALKHPDTWMNEFLEIFQHSIPKMFFVSIPFFTFLLWLLYIRSRKQYYFVAHSIFTLHLYCAIFLLMIVVFPLSFIDHPFANNAEVFITLFAPALYLFLSMKLFYKQAIGKTLLKFLLLIISSSVVFITLILCFLFNAVLAMVGTH